MDATLDTTQQEILRTLFIPSGDTVPAADRRIPLWVIMVFDLLMEVEALRAALLTVDGTSTTTTSAYSRAYRATAYLTHNAAGPQSGLEKLLALFYPPVASGEQREARAWRECLMLRRLGFSHEAIRAYQDEARRAETFT